ncbi:DedA family protein [Deinococcus sp. UYEF24]
MIEPLLHWLDTLNPVAVHLVNFLLLVLEGIGVPAVPYEASMLALGLMTHSGRVQLWQAILIGTVGNTLGNVIGYYIGSRGLRMIPEATQRKLGLTQIQVVLERYGPWMAVISRWFGPLRTLFILYARVAGLKPLPYAACSFVGALTWTAAWQIGLWAGGTAFVQLWHRYQLYALLILAIIAVPVFLLLRARRHRAEVPPAKTRPSGRQGSADASRNTEVAP